MRKRKKLAILIGCALMYSGFASVVNAEEAETGDVVELEEVVVAANRLKQINPVKITVISEEEIKAKGARNVAEAIKDLSGLNVTVSNNKGKSVAQIRGSDADNTKIYIDGVPLSPVGDGKVDLNAIPADNVAKIEIIKGAVPVIYGSNAPGGVIYITTKNAVGKTTTSVTITTGSENARSMYAAIGGDTGKVNFNIGYKKESTDGYTAHSSLDGEYFNGKATWQLTPKSTLSVFGSYSEQTKQLPNRIDSAGQIIVNPGQGGTIGSRNRYWSGSYNWEYDPLKISYIGTLYSQKLNDKSDLNLKVYQSRENSHLRAYNYDHWLHQDWEGTTTGWELQQVIRTSKTNTVTWGYNQETRDFTEFTDNVASDGSRSNAAYDYDGYSFYIQDIAKFSRKLTTSLGFRYEKNDDHVDVNTIAYLSPGKVNGSGSSSNPVFSFNYALDDKTTLHGSLGTSYKWPNAKERSGPGGIYGQPTTYWQENGVWHGDGVGPNGMGIVYDTLFPEEVINREIGVSRTLGSRFNIDITLFNKDITNMIKGQGFGQGHTQYYNIPHVDMSGYEVEVSQKFSERIKGFLNYTYTDAFDTLLQEQVRDIPYRKFSGGLNYKGTDGVGVNLAVGYIGPRTSVFSNGNGNGTGDTGRTAAIVQNLPGYYSVDLKVSKSIKDEEYYFKITNLFDREYYNGAYLVAPGRYVETGVTLKL